MKSDYTTLTALSARVAQTTSAYCQVGRQLTGRPAVGSCLAWERNAASDAALTGPQPSQALLIHGFVTLCSSLLQLKTDYDALAVSLEEAGLERGALAAAFAAKAGALAEVEAAHGAACAAGRDLQGRLDAAAAMHSELAGEIGRLRSELAEKVGC